MKYNRTKVIKILRSIYREDLENLYVKNNMTIQNIADFYNVNYESIRQLLIKLNILLRKGVKRNQFGKNNSNWKNNPSYRTLHMRVEYQRGKPNRCDECGNNNPNIKYEWANISGYYKDVYDFKRLCIKCHKKQHLRMRDSKGRFT